MEVSIPKVHPTGDFFMKIALKHKKIPKGAAISKNSIKNKDSKPSNRWHGKFFFCAPWPNLDLIVILICFGIFQRGPPNSPLNRWLELPLPPTNM
jgi:hypothetical protein